MAKVAQNPNYVLYVVYGLIPVHFKEWVTLYEKGIMGAPSGQKAGQT
jgi:hypothetical protein